MVVNRGFRFEFEIPEDWKASRSGERHIFHGPRKEELIVSGALLEGAKEGPEAEATRQRLFQNATAAVEEAARQPELTVIKPFGREDGAARLPSWTLHAQTKEGDVFFSQAVLTSPAGLLLVTFEAPKTAESLGFYRQFLGSIRPAPVNCGGAPPPKHDERGH